MKFDHESLKIAHDRLQSEIETLRKLGEKDSIEVQVDGLIMHFDPQELQVLKKTQFDFLYLYKDRISKIQDLSKEHQGELEFLKHLQIEDVAIYDKTKSGKSYSLVNRKDRILQLTKEIQDMKFEYEEIEKYLLTGEF